MGRRARKNLHIFSHFAETFDLHEPKHIDGVTYSTGRRTVAMCGEKHHIIGEGKTNADRRAVTEHQVSVWHADVTKNSNCPDCLRAYYGRALQANFHTGISKTPIYSLEKIDEDKLPVNFVLPSYHGYRSLYFLRVINEYGASLRRAVIGCKAGWGAEWEVMRIEPKGWSLEKPTLTIGEKLRRDPSSIYSRDYLVKEHAIYAMLIDYSLDEPKRSIETKRWRTIAEWESMIPLIIERRAAEAAKRAAEVEEEREKRRAQQAAIIAERNGHGEVLAIAWLETNDQQKRDALAYALKNYFQIDVAARHATATEEPIGGYDRFGERIDVV